MTEPTVPTSTSSPLQLLAAELPAPLIDALMTLSVRMDESYSGVAAHAIATYVEVFEATLGDGGLGAWLSRLFEAESDATGRELVVLYLPRWQISALRFYGATHGADVSLVLAAMLDRTLAVAIAEGAGIAPGAWQRTLDALVSEHRHERELAPRRTA